MAKLASTEQENSGQTVGLELRTGNMNKRVTAGKLTEVGETFTLRGIETKDSDEYGAYYTLAGEQNSGPAIEIVFSNAKLHRLLSDHWNELVDKRINISGVGIGYDREYVI